MGWKMGYLQKFNNLMQYERILKPLNNIIDKKCTNISNGFSKKAKEKRLMNYNNLLNANYHFQCSKYIKSSLFR